MPRNFDTGSQIITLDAPPWNVTREIHIYVQHKNGKLALYGSADCDGQKLSPLSLTIERGESTGLYFYIAPSSDPGSQFPAGEKDHLPLVWKKPTSCPETVLYGKMRVDHLAFSMADIYQHDTYATYDFDIVVDPGNGAPPLSTSMFEKIDPTIVEKGEGPPSGM